MKLNIGDRIKYNDSIYIVIGTYFTTIYLCETNDNNKIYNYKMQEIYKKYKDIEFLGKGY